VWKDVKVPEGKVLIPSVIAHTMAVVEHSEMVVERIMTFTLVVGRERVIRRGRRWICPGDVVLASPTLI
jgi:5-methyltetrahydropteroyltriglutamate--homocysteine methyltransferase